MLPSIGHFTTGRAGRPGVIVAKHHAGEVGDDKRMVWLAMSSGKTGAADANAARNVPALALHSVEARFEETARARDGARGLEGQSKEQAQRQAQAWGEPTAPEPLGATPTPEPEPAAEAKPLRPGTDERAASWVFAPWGGGDRAARPGERPSSTGDGGKVFDRLGANPATIRFGSSSAGGDRAQSGPVESVAVKQPGSWRGWRQDRLEHDRWAQGTVAYLQAIQAQRGGSLGKTLHVAA